MPPLPRVELFGFKSQRINSPSKSTDARMGIADVECIVTPKRWLQCRFYGHLGPFEAILAPLSTLPEVPEMHRQVAPDDRSQSTAAPSRPTWHARSFCPPTVLSQPKASSIYLRTFRPSRCTHIFSFKNQSISPESSQSGSPHEGWLCFQSPSKPAKNSSKWVISPVF